MGDGHEKVEVYQKLFMSFRSKCKPYQITEYVYMYVDCSDTGQTY